MKKLLLAFHRGHPHFQKKSFVISGTKTGLNWLKLVSRFSDTMSEEEEEIGSASSLMGRVKLARQEALRKKLEAEMTENFVQQLQIVLLGAAGWLHLFLV